MSSKIRFSAFALMLIALTLTFEAQEASEAREGAAESPARRGTLADKIWWNQPDKVKDLGLDAAQRTRMDALLNAFLKTTGANAAGRRDAFAGLADALVRGDREAARAIGDELADGVGEPMRRQVEMMLDVTAVLTAAQRKMLAEKYPGLLNGFWIRTADPRRLGRGRGR